MTVLPVNQLDNDKYVLRATFTKMQLGAINYWRKWGKKKLEVLSLGCHRHRRGTSHPSEFPALLFRAMCEFFCVLYKGSCLSVLAEKTWNYNHLRTSIRSQHFTFGYFEAVSIDLTISGLVFPLKQCSASCAKDLKTVFSSTEFLVLLLSTSLL